MKWPIPTCDGDSVLITQVGWEKAQGPALRSQNLQAASNRLVDYRRQNENLHFWISPLVSATTGIQRLAALVALVQVAGSGLR